MCVCVCVREREKAGNSRYGCVGISVCIKVYQSLNKNWGKCRTFPQLPVWAMRGAGGQGRRRAWNEHKDSLCGVLYSGNLWLMQRVFRNSDYAEVVQVNLALVTRETRALTSKYSRFPF